MTALVLAGLAVVLAGPVPAVLARATWIRKAPRAAMTLWQAVALAAVLAAVGATLALFTDSWFRTVRGPVEYAVAAAALLVTAVVLGRLLLTGHLVGTRLRAMRRRHRELVDLVAAKESGVHVLEENAPLAYCLPGVAHRRVVVSRGATQTLGEAELDAVLAHERAHLLARHDLVLEAFTVLNNAFPRFVSSGRALAEVRLLVEVLADRASKRRHGAVPLVRALLSMTGAPTPAVALAAGGGPSEIRARMEVLTDDRSHRVLAGALYAAAWAVLAFPTAFVAYPWLTSLPG